MGTARAAVTVTTWQGSVPGILAVQALLTVFDQVLVRLLANIGVEQLQR